MDEYEYDLADIDALGGAVIPGPPQQLESTEAWIEQLWRGVAALPNGCADLIHEPDKRKFIARITEHLNDQ